MTTAPNMTLAPIIRLRRFDSAFAPLGEALDIPLPAPDGPFSQVLAMQLEGDESHLGLLVSRYGSAGSDTRFALIAGSEVVALSDALSSGTSTAAGGTLAYGGGYFLRCSGAPSQCHLIEAAGADAVGRPVPFSPPGADVVNAILWHQGRFFVGASSGDDAPAQRVLGWIDVAGQWGHQQVWSDDSRVLGGAATTKLLLGRSDEIFWIDDALSAGGLEEMDVLLRIARSCP